MPFSSGLATKAKWLEYFLTVFDINPGIDIGIELTSSLFNCIRTHPLYSVVLKLSAGKIWSGPINKISEINMLYNSLIF